MTNITDYSGLPKSKLLELLGDPTLSKSKQLKANKAFQAILRMESIQLKKKLELEREGTAAQQKALKDTKVGMLGYRKTMQDAYRTMNKTITVKSLLNNLDAFEKQAGDYKEQCANFCNALDAHIVNLKTVKAAQ